MGWGEVERGVGGRRLGGAEGERGEEGARVRARTKGLEDLGVDGKGGIFREGLGSGMRGGDWAA